MSKTPCAGCEHRRDIPGDAHSRCDAFGDMTATVYLLSCLGSPPANAPEMNKDGVANGWCEWPINFDPIWINKCPLRAEKEKSDGRVQEGG